MLMFCLLCSDAIDKIYDSDDDVTLTQVVLQNTSGVSTENKDTENDEGDESYRYCVVIAEDLDHEDNEDLLDENDLESKCKYVVTELLIYAYVRCTYITTRFSVYIQSLIVMLGF